METSAYYALGIPLFVALMAAEVAALRWRGRSGGYELRDTVTNLGCGLGQIVFGVFSGPLVLALYRWFGGRFGLAGWPRGSVLPWLVAFVGVDLCYYAMHRASHAWPTLFAVHSVHHQSERMNVSVALRQTWFSDIVALLFYWPLPLLAVGEGPFFAAVAVLSVYQVTLHTELLPKPRGALARAFAFVFNTPSHHRVHHALIGVGEGKNFGATLIVWDRLFGTFEAEVSAPAPVYGVSPAFRSFDPVWAQVFPFVAARVSASPAPRAPSRAMLWLAVALLVAVGACAGIVLPRTLGQGLVVRAPIAVVMVGGLATIGALLDGRLGRRAARVARAREAGITARR